MLRTYVTACFCVGGWVLNASTLTQTHMGQKAEPKTCAGMS